MESGAILMYLADKTGKLWQQAAFEPKWRTVEWLMWQMGGLGPVLGQAHHFLHFNPGASDYAAKRYTIETKRLYNVLDQRLEGRDYVAGDYSIADIAIWPWVSRFEFHKIDLADQPSVRRWPSVRHWPNVRRWYMTVAGREAVQKGYHVPVPQPSIPMPGQGDSIHRMLYASEQDSKRPHDQEGALR